MEDAFQAIIDTHDNISVELASGKPVNTSSVQELVNLIAKNLAVNSYIEKRQKLRSILRFWSGYLAAQEEVLPQEALDITHSRPTILHGGGRFSSNINQPKRQEYLSSEFKDIEVAHEQLTGHLADNQSVDPDIARSLINKAVQSSLLIPYIEERQKLRSILRFWTTYLVSKGNEVPKRALDIIDHRPATLHTFSEKRIIEVEEVFGNIKKIITTLINEEEITVLVEPRNSLLELLRELLGLTGTKEGCGNGNCGACSVLLDGVLVDSCLVLAVEADGKSITTIEGLVSHDGLHPLQEKFLEHAALQCGICTPGFIMAAKALLDHNPNPTEHEVRYWIAGNLCRCTGYDRIVKAVLDAATQIRAEKTHKS
jgi:carbon-monoxide dehydrogenase small subunit